MFKHFSSYSYWLYEYGFQQVILDRDLFKILAFLVITFD